MCLSAIQCSEAIVSIVIVEIFIHFILVIFTLLLIGRYLSMFNYGRDAIPPIMTIFARKMDMP